MEIEATDGYDARVDVRHVLSDGRAPFGITHRAHYPARLVKQDIDEGLARHELAVDLDLVVPRIRFGPELGHDLAVNLYLTRFDPLFGTAPRHEAGARQDLLQTFLSHAVRYSASPCGPHKNRNSGPPIPD